MASRRYLSDAEAQVLEGCLPHGLTAEMRDLALCLFEALVIDDERCGQPELGPTTEWATQLRAWAKQVRMQLQHLANEKGGTALYLAKGVAVYLSARDHAICGKFRGNNYRELAREYGLTEMRVRQIVDTWQRERFLARQQGLPGFD